MKVDVTNKTYGVLMLRARVERRTMSNVMADAVEEYARAHPISIGDLREVAQEIAWGSKVVPTVKFDEVPDGGSRVSR